MGDTRVSPPQGQAQAGATRRDTTRVNEPRGVRQPQAELLNFENPGAPHTFAQKGCAYILCLAYAGNAHCIDCILLASLMCWNDFRLKRRSALLNNERSLEPTPYRAGPGPLARS